MNIQPSQAEYLNLKKDSDRIPLLGERRMMDFAPSHFFRAQYGEAAHAFLFESGKGPDETARYTFMGQSNSKVLQTDHGQNVISDNGSRETRSGSPAAILDLMDVDTREASFDHAPHFWGGWVGYLGYELAQYLDAIPLRSKEDLNLPLLYFFQVDRLWVYDHKTQFLKFIIAEPCEGDPGSHYESAMREIKSHWDEAQSALASRPDSDAPKSDSSSNAHDPGLRSNISQNDYMENVERAKRYIEAGDIYQANLSQRFEGKFTGDPLDLYENLRQVNPSPFSGYMKMNDLILVSSSPERLVKVQKGILETRPIAGTRPRGKDSEEDARLTSELLLNEKEQAEHLMLVDLERNDMGRVCEYGSVRVTDRMFVEQYSHVSHIVSNIRGVLKQGVHLRDILAAVFPGGTITGCPKIRCMEIIDELEPVTRGPYCGSFGYIGFDDTLDLNIIIRTIILTQGKAYFHVGAGIVADSIPDKEYQETLHKAAAMIKVLTQQQ